MPRSASMLIGLWLLIVAPAMAVEIGRAAPEIADSVWLNASSQRLADLRGQVVMVKFWTFDCYNCRNVEPYVIDWYGRYREQGFTVLAVHSPEFDHERDIDNVRRYIRKHHVPYPVIIDNDFVTWKRYANRYWPAMYLIDKSGIVRYIKIGEGDYRRTEATIRRLLAEPSKNPR